MSEHRFIRYGYGLDDNAIPVPIAGQLQVEYSVDPWTTATHGHVIFVHDDVEYNIPEADLARFLGDGVVSDDN